MALIFLTEATGKKFVVNEFAIAVIWPDKGIDEFGSTIITNTGTKIKVKEGTGHIVNKIRKQKGQKNEYQKTGEKFNKGPEKNTTGPGANADVPF